MRKNVTSGAPWEEQVGYCRAVKIGNQIEISGTTAVKDGAVLFPGDAYKQTKAIFKIAEDALLSLGANFKNVIRTRMYTTDISKWAEIGKAHGEVFQHIKPATTLVEVSALIDPEMVIEIEFTAIL